MNEKPLRIVKSNEPAESVICICDICNTQHKAEDVTFWLRHYKECQLPVLEVLFLSPQPETKQIPDKDNQS